MIQAGHAARDLIIAINPFDAVSYATNSSNANISYD